MSQVGESDRRALRPVVQSQDLRQRANISEKPKRLRHVVNVHATLCILLWDNLTKPRVCSPALNQPASEVNKPLPHGPPGFQGTALFDTLVRTLTWKTASGRCHSSRGRPAAVASGSAITSSSTGVCPIGTVGFTAQRSRMTQPCSLRDAGILSIIFGRN